MGYIRSDDNRVYVALENRYGAIANISAVNRVPLVKLTAKHTIERPGRRDKTGSRTFAGMPSGLRRRSSFELRSYMADWPASLSEPMHGPLFQAALGGAPLMFGGGIASAGCGAQMVVFQAEHGLCAGQAITYAGEIRFVSSIPDARTVELNAPFTAIPAPGDPIGGTATYGLATDLPSATLFDYWGPSSAVQRILHGAAVDKLNIQLNGDYHQFTFSGPAKDVLDSATFAAGEAEVAEFPSEPAAAGAAYSVIPGHLGQAWLGSFAERFYTITSAELIVDNGIELRSREFGSSTPLAIIPGQRSVTLDFDLFEQDEMPTRALYQAARQQSPVSVMFQLGEQQRQLLGVYAKGIVPELPEFDDSESRLQWRFRNCRAQGTDNDELFVAFG